ncbi:membrane-bound polysaccharide biosynthesis protein, partial [Streptomyces rubellomurinus subsp. indigoferus]
GRRLRYRRVCARLGDRLPSARRLLVVVPDGDGNALRAAGQPVDEAAEGLLPPVVGVPVARPLVPDRDGESGAPVVLSAGSWTAAALSGLAAACADAGHAVVGVVAAR